MKEKPTCNELEDRIREDEDFHSGQLPTQHAAAWSGYIAALLEWSLITEEEHRRLQNHLGPDAALPALAIFLGPQGASETIEHEGIKQSSSAQGVHK
jgi:hypothetical protein